MNSMNLIECPYDKTHVIDPLRMPAHLLKCRRNHPDMELVVCPFNATHEVQKVELRYHMTHCPNRALLDREISLNALLGAAQGKETTQVKGCTDLPNFSRRRRDEDMVDDEWDKELEDSRFSLFPRREQEQNATAASRPRIQSRRQVETDAELRRPTTLGEAARLSQLPADEKAEPVVTAATQPSLQHTVATSVPLGRGRARTIPNSESLQRPGAAQVPPVSSPLLNSQVLRSGLLLYSYPTLARGRAMLLERDSSS